MANQATVDDIPIRDYIRSAAHVTILGATDITGSLKYLIKLDDGRAALVSARLLHSSHPQTVIRYLVARISWQGPDENEA